MPGYTNPYGGYGRQFMNLPEDRDPFSYPYRQTKQQPEPQFGQYDMGPPYDDIYQQQAAPPQQQKPDFMSAYEEMLKRQKGPYSEMYDKYLAKGLPTEEQYRPTKGSRLGAALSGIGLSLRGDIKGAGESVEQHLRAPYEEALRRYGIEGKLLGEQAGREDTERTRQLTAYRSLIDDYRAQQKQDFDMATANWKVETNEVTGESEYTRMGPNGIERFPRGKTAQTPQEKSRQAVTQATDIAAATSPIIEGRLDRLAGKQREFTRGQAELQRQEARRAAELNEANIRIRQAITQRQQEKMARLQAELHPADPASGDTPALMAHIQANPTVPGTKTLTSSFLVFDPETGRRTLTPPEDIHSALEPDATEEQIKTYDAYVDAFNVFYKNRKDINSLRKRKEFFQIPPQPAPYGGFDYKPGGGLDFGPGFNFGPGK